MEEKQPMSKSTSDTSAEKGSMKTLSLVKGRHHFCFGMRRVRRQACWIRWWNWSGGVTFHSIGLTRRSFLTNLVQHLAKELKAYLPKKVA